MKCKVKAASGSFKFPQTQVVSLLNDKLILFVRSWNGPDAVQKVVDEVNHYLSSADADMEVTTPFEFVENLSHYANKVRIAMMLANEVLYITENTERYSQGFEVALVYRNQRELVWSAIGRFQIIAHNTSQVFPLSDGGRFLDGEVLLPVALLGIGRDPDLRCGSLSIKDLNKIEIKSSYADDSSWWHAEIQEF